MQKNAERRHLQHRLVQRPQRDTVREAEKLARARLVHALLITGEAARTKLAEPLLADW